MFVTVYGFSVVFWFYAALSHYIYWYVYPSHRIFICFISLVALYVVLDVSDVFVTYYAFFFYVKGL